MNGFCPDCTSIAHDGACYEFTGKELKNLFRQAAMEIALEMCVDKKRIPEIEHVLRTTLLYL